MKWQVRYALENIRKNCRLASVQHVRGDAISITMPGRPDAVAVISDAYLIDSELATQYHSEYPCQRRLKIDPPWPAVAEVKLTHLGT